MSGFDKLNRIRDAYRTEEQKTKIAVARIARKDPSPCPECGEKAEFQCHAGKDLMYKCTNKECEKNFFTVKYRLKR